MGQQCLLVGKWGRCWGRAVLCLLARSSWCQQQAPSKGIVGVPCKHPVAQPLLGSRLLLRSPWTCSALRRLGEFGTHRPPSLTLRQSMPWMELPLMAVPRGTLHCCGKSVHAMCWGASWKPLDCRRATVRSMPIRWLQATFPAGHSQLPSATSPCWPTAAITLCGGAVFFLLRWHCA